jgi:hypothetical protein
VVDVERNAAPKPGDVIIGRDAASPSVYVLSVWGLRARALALVHCDSREDAIVHADHLARDWSVDVWDTADGTTFDRVADYRTI